MAVTSITARLHTPVLEGAFYYLRFEDPLRPAQVRTLIKALEAHQDIERARTQNDPTDQIVVRFAPEQKDKASVALNEVLRQFFGLSVAISVLAEEPS